MAGSTRRRRHAAGEWFEVRAFCDEGAAAGAERLVKAARAEGYRARRSKNGHGEDIAAVFISGLAPAGEVERLVKACGMSASYRRLAHDGSEDTGNR